MPRERLASFDPQLIAKYQRRFPGFDEKIISMYARGMSTREIQGHLRELYGLEVYRPAGVAFGSPDLVSTVTDAVLDEVAEWQNRPLERLYPLVFLDALRVSLHLRRRLSARCQGRSPGLQHQTLRGELAVHLREQRLGQTTLSQNGAEAAQGGLASGRLRLRPGWHHPS